MPRRSKLVSPWTFCDRCGAKTHISEIIWQDGKKLCTQNDCVDTKYPALPQERDALVRAQAEYAVDSDEMQPDPKLSPESSESGDDIIFDI